MPKRSNDLENLKQRTPDTQKYETETEPKGRETKGTKQTAGEKQVPRGSSPPKTIPSTVSSRGRKAGSGVFTVLFRLWFTQEKAPEKLDA